MLMADYGLCGVTGDPSARWLGSSPARAWGHPSLGHLVKPSGALDLSVLHSSAAPFGPGR